MIKTVEEERVESIYDLLTLYEREQKKDKAVGGGDEKVDAALHSTLIKIFKDDSENIKKQMKQIDDQHIRHQNDHIYHQRKKQYPNQPLFPHPTDMFYRTNFAAPNQNKSVYPLESFFPSLSHLVMRSSSYNEMMNMTKENENIRNTNDNDDGNDKKKDDPRNTGGEQKHRGMGGEKQKL